MLIIGRFLAVMSFVWGACIGSFLNVCIYRIPRDMSIVKPRSHCPHCKTMIPWYENIPLLSYLVLRAKCSRCKGRISPRYFLIELLTACLFYVVWLKYFSPKTLMFGDAIGIWVVPVYWTVISGLIVGTFIDFEHMIIPDRITIGGIVAGFALSFLVPELHVDNGNRWHSLLLSVCGAAAGGGLLWAVGGVGSFIFKKEAMGLGDVKLLAAIGAFFGWRAILFTVMVSSFVGTIVGLALVLRGRKKMKSRIPYGPYLAMGAVVWVLYGAAIWEWYYNLFYLPGPP
jgi:leader peptidase (prepilin peptidase)/N-methyltransferase